MLTLGKRAAGRWAALVAVVLAVVYAGCTSKPPADKVHEAGENGGASTSGASFTGGSDSTGGTGASSGGVGNTGATNNGGIGNTGADGGIGNTGADGGIGNTGADGGIGNTPGGGSSGTAPVDDASCTSGSPPQEDMAYQRYRLTTPNGNYDSQTDATARFTAMTQAEKISILSGGPSCSYDDETCFQALGVARAAVNYPNFRMRDGPRGVRGVVGEITTTFAVAEARAASFDLNLEFRVGQIMAVEMRALRADMILAPTVNVLRHPGWARAQETYGEDPVLVGEMGAAFVRGMQEGPNGMPACAKHYAGNNTDENRGGGGVRGANMIVDERTLRENYLRNFQIIVEKSDPACIMAAYNDLNGQNCPENPHLLTDVLRSAPSGTQHGWNWTGFVVSDWAASLGAGHGNAAITAGLDLEMPTNRAFADLGSGQATQIDRATHHVLNVRGTFGQLTSAYITQHGQAPSLNIASTAAHVALARETAEKGAVLLKNCAMPSGPSAGHAPFCATGVLPLAPPPTTTSIVVLGPDRAKPVANTSTGAHGLGDRGSSNTNPPHAVSVVQGIMNAATTIGGITVTQSANAADAAGKSVAIVPVTMAHEDEGEAYGGGGDRDTLTLSTTEPRHWTQKPTAFINAVKAAAGANTKVVVLLMVGSAIVMEDWMNSADAIVQTFYPGQEGGDAIANLLFGRVNFSGKLPFTVATNPSHYPTFGNTATSVTFEYLHGYRRFEANNTPPRFWFGHGLSYTHYDYSNLRVLCPSGIDVDGKLTVEVTVTNAGTIAGEEVIELYVGYPSGLTPAAPPKELKAFMRAGLTPGQARTVQLQVPARDLRHWVGNGWALATGMHTVYVGGSGDTAALLSAPFTVN